MPTPWNLHEYEYELEKSISLNWPYLISQEPEKSIRNPCLMKKSQPFITIVARNVSHLMEDSNWKCVLQIVSSAGGKK